MMLGTISHHLPFLCFTLFWQVMSVKEIIKFLRLYKKTQTGTYVTGQVSEVRKIPAIEEAGHNYEYTIKYHWPLPENEYLLKHQFSYFGEPVIGKEFKIWVDQDSPDRSILIASFEESWGSVVIHGLVSFGCLYPDWIWIKQLYKYI